MQLKQVDPRLLEPNPWNTNVVSMDNEAKLKTSIDRLGMFKPILCRTVGPGRLQILGGAHRTEQAIEAGMKAVPVLDLGVIEDAKAKEISLVDNARYGVDDAMALAELLRELNIGDVIGSFMPYGDADILSIMNSVDVNLDELGLDDDNEATEEETEAQSKSRVAKTHEIIRFKVSIADGERTRKLINTTIRSQGMKDGDDLQNAGDALVHILFFREDS
jgi:ParB-like chromosome segregation protein Spo0J